MTTALSAITRRRILGLAAVAAGALVLTGALGVVTFILVTHKPAAHPHPAVTVRVPVPAATITLGAVAKPQPTVTVTELVASAPSGGSGWDTVAAAGTAVGGLGGLVAGIAAVAALMRRKPETASPAQATDTASP